MARRKSQGRAVHGIVLLDKPTGMTSNAALQKVKRLFQANKAGHTGSLDPMATGMLPICFGEATKVSAFLLGADKAYTVTACLGQRTNTGDADGQVIATASADAIRPEAVLSLLPRYIGEGLQVPPMYSAIKHQGQPLYKLARQGVEIKRQPRAICIHDIQLLSYEKTYISLYVHCSKGTYIRTLIDDIGQALGCGAHVTALRRLYVAPYSHQPMLTLEQVQMAAQTGFLALDSLLQPIDSALTAWPAVYLSAAMAYDLKRGQAVQVAELPPQGLLRLYCGATHFLGMGHVQEDGKVAPKRLMNL